MSSPVDIPFSEFIKIDRRKQDPVYLQIVYQFIQAIQRRLLGDGVRIPGGLPLSHELGIHRHTMVAALDELEAQGWVEIRPNIVNFVRNIEAKKINGEQKPVGRSRFTGTSDFSFRENFVLDLLTKSTIVNITSQMAGPITASSRPMNWPSSTPLLSGGNRSSAGCPNTDRKSVV